MCTLTLALDQAEAAACAEASWGPEEIVTTPSHDVDRLPMYGMRPVA